MTSVIRAVDFGAAGDGSGDDGPALRRAAAAALAAGPGARLVLDKGTYAVGGSGGGPAACGLLLADAHGLEVEAVGARLVVRDPQAGGLWLRGGADVRIVGLEVDFDPAPFAQSVVVAVDPAAAVFEVEVEPGSLPLDHPAFLYDYDVLHPSQFGSFFDPVERRLKAGHVDHVFVRPAESLGGSRWRLTVADRAAYGPSATDRLTGVEPGDRFVLAARWTGCGIAMFGVDGVRLDGVRVRAAASHGILAERCGDVTLSDSGVSFGPSGERLITTDGDGFHYKDGRGFARVEGGLFEGMLDDGFNDNATPFVVRSVGSGPQVVLSAGAQLESGDRLLFQSPESGLVRGSAVVEEVVDGPEPGTRSVRLNSPVDGLVAGTSHFDADLACNLDASGTGYAITGTTYRWHRGIAVRPRNGPGRVEGVTVVGVGSHGVLACNDPDWPEGPIPHDLEIVGNHFEATGYTNGTEAVRVVGARRGGGPAVEPCVERVRIEGNTFVDLRGDAVFVGGCRDVTGDWPR